MVKSHRFLLIRLAKFRLINKMKFKFKNKGFTLTEMMVAVALFAVVVFVSLGALVSIFDANRRAQSSKTVVDNLNLALEDMTRTVRFGDHYYCGANDREDRANECELNPQDALSVTFEGDRVIYRLCEGEIRRGDDEEDCNDMQAITSSDTVIDHLDFYVFNSEDSSPNRQPYVLAVIKGHVGNKATLQSSFSIQTIMSQRKLDIP